MTPSKKILPPQSGLPDTSHPPSASLASAVSSGSWGSTALLLLSSVAVLSCTEESESTWYPLPDASGVDAAADVGADTGNEAGTDAGSDVADDGRDAVSEISSESATDAVGPHVAFTSPVDGATVPNPVVFRIEASEVESVEIFADETYSLGAAWDPTQRDTLIYRFAGTGVPRSVHVTGRVGGLDVARDDLVFTVAPDSCEDRFFVTEFDAHNEDPGDSVDLTTIREEALAALKQEVQTLQACGAGVTLGAMMSLLLYEGGLRVCAFNTRCEENSYNPTATDCDADPEALYSYQFGLGAIHTSNFHPCKGGSYTLGMRQAFLEHAASAGFDTSGSLMDAAMTARFHQVCPSATPNAVDYYLLGAHAEFGIPRDGYGNYFDAYGQFPMFSPVVSLRLTFRMLSGACTSIQDDRDAITIYGGGDATYGQADKQNTILSLYEDFAAANCE